MSGLGRNQDVPGTIRPASDCCHLPMYELVRAAESQYQNVCVLPHRMGAQTLLPLLYLPCSQSVITWYEDRSDRNCARPKCKLV